MPKTANEWRIECNYLDRTADKRGRVPEMNNDTSVFVRYCQMQQKQAERDGFHDVVTYIGHILDDLTA